MALAKLADDPQPDWELAADRLADLVAARPEAFADKSRFAMDWYYPVLGGAVRGADAARRLAAGWDKVRGAGAGCPVRQRASVGDGRGDLRAGAGPGRVRDARARRPRCSPPPQHLRHPDGSYWTGWQYANQAHFPAERSSWTAAAVVLAADALMGLSGGAGVFRESDRSDKTRKGKTAGAERMRLAVRR